jgi:hypothetical protein
MPRGKRMERPAPILAVEDPAQFARVIEQCRLRSNAIQWAAVATVYGTDAGLLRRHWSYLRDKQRRQYLRKQRIRLVRAEVPELLCTDERLSPSPPASPSPPSPPLAHELAWTAATPQTIDRDFPSEYTDLYHESVFDVLAAVGALLD